MGGAGQPGKRADGTHVVGFGTVGWALDSEAASAERAGVGDGSGGCERLSSGL